MVLTYLWRLMNWRDLVLVGFFPTVFLVSCSQYQQVLKSDDFALKFQKAKEYFDKEDYYRALPLLEELVTYYKGTKEVQDIYYYYAFTHYYTGEYLVAAYHFKNFATTYTNDSRAEECLFMNAKCYYVISPNYMLEQSYTEKAQNELALFVNTYPESRRVADANQMMDELRMKEEEKSYYAADLYFNMRKYKAAAIAFEDLLADFPDSPVAEKISFLILKSYFQYAMNSVESKQQERYERALDSYRDFVSRYPESEFMKDASQIYEQTNKNLENLNKSETNEQDQAQR